MSEVFLNMMSVQIFRVGGRTMLKCEDFGLGVVNFSCSLVGMVDNSGRAGVGVGT